MRQYREAIQASLAIFLLCGAAHGFEFYTNRSGEPLRWEKGFIHWRFEGRVSQRFKRATRDAFAEWGAVNGLRFIETTCTPDIEIRQLRKRELSFFHLGDSVVHFDGSAITKASIRINWRNPISRRIPKTILLHEIGHCLGLAHSGDPESVMHNVYGAQKNLTEDDMNGLVALYAIPKEDTPEF